jgi:hypothetical protein
VCAIHDSHAACADLLLDSIVRQSVPDHPAPQQDQVTSYSIAKRTEVNGSSDQSNRFVVFTLGYLGTARDFNFVFQRGSSKMWSSTLQK